MSTVFSRSAAPSFLFSLFCILPLAAQNKPTSLSEANAAVESNLRTSEGKAYDEKTGNEFVQKHLAEVRQCKPTAGNDMRSFWFLLKLDKDGHVNEVLLYPETKLGTCARNALVKDTFSPPPHPDYWVSVYLQLSH